MSLPDELKIVARDGKTYELRRETQRFFTVYKDGGDHLWLVDRSGFGLRVEIGITCEVMEAV